MWENLFLIIPKVTSIPKVCNWPKPSPSSSRIWTLRPSSLCWDQISSLLSCSLSSWAVEGGQG